MPVTMQEYFDSRSRTTGDRPTSTWHGWMSGTESQAMAFAALEGYLPEADGDLKLDGITKCEHQGGGVWEWTADYVSPDEKQEPGDPSQYAFDTTGGQQHIPHSKETLRMRR